MPIQKESMPKTASLSLNTNSRREPVEAPFAKGSGNRRLSIPKRFCSEGNRIATRPRPAEQIPASRDAHRPVPRIAAKANGSRQNPSGKNFAVSDRDAEFPPRSPSLPETRAALPHFLPECFQKVRPNANRRIFRIRKGFPQSGVQRNFATGCGLQNSRQRVFPQRLPTSKKGPRKGKGTFSSSPPKFYEERPENSK